VIFDALIAYEIIIGSTTKIAINKGKKVSFGVRSKKRTTKISISGSNDFC
jgi:hypothetical protein